MNEEERAERAARIQERAAKTRLMPDESGQLVKHKQADDGRWLPIEKKPGQTPTRNRPIQVSTAAHAKKPSAMPYLMLGATAAILGLGAFIALPYLSNTASESSTTPLSTPQQVAQRAAPRPIFWLEAGADRVGAGFLIEKQLVACDAALLDDRLLREFRLRSPEDSRGNRGRSCQLQAIDAELGVALLRIRGVEKPFAKLADEPPAEGTPVRFLSPKYDAHRNDVDLDESAGFMGESFLSGEKTLYHIELAHSGEQTGSPVLSIDDDLLGLLCYQIQNDVATLVPTEELRAFALAAQKLGPSYGLQLEAKHDAGVLANRLMGAADKYGVAALALGMTLQKYAQRGQALEMGLQQARGALSSSIAEADALLELVPEELVDELTARPELTRELRALLLKFRREIVELRTRVHRPRGTVHEYAQQNKKAIRRIDQLETQLLEQLALD